MPESPEVQALAGELDARLRARMLAAVDVMEASALKTPPRLPSSLVGWHVATVARHGKYVDLDFGDGHLIVSLGRHGWARWAAGTAGEARVAGRGAPALLRMEFDDGAWLELTDAGDWVSLALWVVDDPSEVPGVASLGPDPANADFTRADFDAVFRGRRKQLKAILQEQKSLAGIGNAYSDEILFAARLSPVVRASDLLESDLDRLYASTLDVMRSATEARRGIPIGELKATKNAAMLVHGHGGMPCPRCAGAVRDFAFASTTAQYCPECQTGGAAI